MTHEQFIELKTARLAKQAGFDWEVDAMYHTFSNRKNATAKISLCQKLFNYNYYDCDFSAPTQAVLQRWLREVKNYHICITYEYIPAKPQYKSVWNVILFDESKKAFELEDENGNNFDFTTYEAALEAGLQKCLTLLIENKL